MDIIMLAMLAVSFFLVKLLVDWCEYQVEKQ